MLFLIGVSAAVLLLLTALVTLFIIWFKKPSWVLRTIAWLSIRRCGMRIRYVRGHQLVYCYAERGAANGQQSTLVFVHGFSAGKDNWLGTIQKLPRDYHIVAVDLPGHGGTGLPPAFEPACLQTMVDALREILVLSKINERPLHLIGTSMGGAVVGMYAAQYPQEVDRLTMICPCVIAPSPSRYMLDYQKGVNRLLPSTPEEVQKLFTIMVYKKKRVPTNRQILKAVLQMQQSKASFLEQLFNSVAFATKEELEKHLCFVTAPTQVIWGANDEMIDVSGATMLGQIMPTCRRVDILPECGHGVDWDQPEAVAEALVDFRR